MVKPRKAKPKRRNGKGEERQEESPLRREAGLTPDEDKVRPSKARPRRRKGCVKEMQEGMHGLVPYEERKASPLTKR